jgi:chromosome segregation ATPase
MTTEKKAATPQEVFGNALLRALASQRDGYANAAAETAAKLDIAQGAVRELQASLAAVSKELAASKTEVESLKKELSEAKAAKLDQPQAGQPADSEGSTQD